MNLGAFHARVARALRRGTSLDDSIPTWVEEAVQQIEGNYNFQYMKRWMEISVDADADNPHLISLYNTPIKKVALLRYYSEDEGRFKVIKGPKDPQERATREEGFPTSFWLNGVSDIVLDSIPDEDLELEANLVVFTSWQPDETNFEHYLIDRHRQLILSETILVANMELRDERLELVYGKMNERAWVQVRVTEEELQYGGETGAQMEYSPPFEEIPEAQDND